ncbi:MAG: DUF1453 domain-containing protein [Verrucomicrobiota bacterium]|nr:DUF1453 domain-containing protein [Verrucomicrobiota bacterium]
MPLLPILFLLLLPVFVLLAIPLSLVQRYRLGRARRQARGWITTVNLLLMSFSTAVFVWASAFTNFWVPRAFSHALSGLAAGALLGVFGLALTRWERAGRTLHYTPNRWVVLLLSLAVAARVLYSFWRLWHAWRTTGTGSAWLVQSGAPGSLFISAIVVGYYFVYAIGVWRRLRRAT